MPVRTIQVVDLRKMCAKVNGSSAKSDASNGCEDCPQSDDPLLVCFSPTSIRLLAESAGHAEIDEPSARLLAEDVSYRIRRLLDSALNFSRNLNQSQLTTDHVNRALVDCDCKPVYGHSIGRKRIDFIYVPEANVYAQVDREVKLSGLIEDIVENRHSLNIKRRQLSLTGSWISLKGGSMVNGSGAPSSSHATTTGSATLITSQPPEHLSAYYNFFIEIVFADDFSLYKTVLCDLSRNAHITELLPCFLNFIELGINDVNPTEKNLFRLLMLANAVIRNKSFYTEIARNVVCLLDSLIISVMEPIGQGKRSETHWALREYAANTLALVVRNWSQVLIGNEIFYNLLRFMADLLRDRSRPLDAHYAVICFLRSLGQVFVSSYLLPHLGQYIVGLETLLCEHENTSSETYFAVIKLHRTLLDTIVGHLRSLKRRDWNAFGRCYNQFGDLFGDSLHTRIPIDLDIVSYCKADTKPDPRLFSTTDQSGDELLQTFYPDTNSPFGDLFDESEWINDDFNNSNHNDENKSLPNGSCTQKITENRIKQKKQEEENNNDSDSDEFTFTNSVKIIRPTILIRIQNRDIQADFISKPKTQVNVSVLIDRSFLAACKRIPYNRKRNDHSRWQHRMYSCDLNCVL